MTQFSVGGDDGNGTVGASNSTSQPSRFKRLRVGLTLAASSTTVTTSAENVASVTERENDAVEEVFLVEDDDDMEGVDEENNQSEGEEEPEEEESGDEDGEEEELEEGEYQENEVSEEVDDTNQGQANGEGFIVGNVNSCNSAGSVGTKSSMIGTFTDPDVLDCPICYEPLTVPVFQCDNGHLECSSCCIRIGNKCPSCSLPIGRNRCRSIERIINSITFSCWNLEYGCKETMLHYKREVHEKECEFSPCYCPLKSCNFVASPKKLYAHFRGRHLRSSAQFDYKLPFRFQLGSKHKSVILQEKTDGTIFILNLSNNRVPRAINLIRIGALNSKEEFCYELSVEYEGSTLKLKSVPATMPKWSASQPLRKYLLVPSDFVNSSGSISVAICIEKRLGS